MTNTQPTTAADDLNATAEEATRSLARVASLFATAAATDEATHEMAAALVRCEAAGVKGTAIIAAIDAAIAASGKSGKAPSAGTLSNLRGGYRFAEAAGFSAESDAAAVARSVTIIGNTPKDRREALAAEIAAAPRAKRHAKLQSIRDAAAKGEYRVKRESAPAAEPTAVDPVKALAIVAGNVTAAAPELIGRIDSAEIVAALAALEAASLTLSAALIARGDTLEATTAYHEQMAAAEVTA